MKVLERDTVGREKRYTTDAANRIFTALRTPLPGETPLPGDRASAYTWLPDGLVQTIAYGNGTVTTHAYAPNGWVASIETRDAGGALVSRYDYTYDADGNRTRMREANATPACRAADPSWETGRDTTYGYDALSRLQWVNYPDGRAVTYTYDKVGNRLTETETRDGNPSALKNRAFHYDADNRLRWIDDLLPPGGASDRSVAYLYNLSGDTVSKVLGIVDPSDGTLVSERLRLDFAWDVTGKLRTVTRKKPNQPAETLAEFTYDHAGRRVRKDAFSRFLPGGGAVADTRLYLHDDTADLTEFTPGPGGTLPRVRQYLYAAGRGPLAVENRTPAGSAALWATHFSGGGSGSNNASEPGPDRFSLYAMKDPGRLQVSGDVSGVPGDGKKNAAAKDQAALQSRAFYHLDALGSTVDLTGDAGQVSEAYLYDAWGNFRETADGPGAATCEDDPDLDPSGLYSWETYLGNTQSAFATDPNRLTYTGHEYDPESGLYYARARFYDPEVGRFESEDPLTGDVNRPPSLHKYAYASANPLLYIDPFGMYEASIQGDYIRLRPSEEDFRKYGNIVDMVNSGLFALYTLPEEARRTATYGIMIGMGKFAANQKYISKRGKGDAVFVPSTLADLGVQEHELNATLNVAPGEELWVPRKSPTGEYYPLSQGGQVEVFWGGNELGAGFSAEMARRKGAMNSAIGCFAAVTLLSAGAGYGAGLGIGSLFLSTGWSSGTATIAASYGAGAAGGFTFETTRQAWFTVDSMQNGYSFAEAVNRNADPEGTAIATLGGGLFGRAGHALSYGSPKGIFPGGSYLPPPTSVAPSIVSATRSISLFRTGNAQGPTLLRPSDIIPVEGGFVEPGQGGLSTLMPSQKIRRR